MGTIPSGSSPEHLTIWKQQSGSFPKHELEYDYYLMLAHLYDTQDLTGPPHAIYEEKIKPQHAKTEEKRQAETCSRKVRKGN